MFLLTVLTGSLLVMRLAVDTSRCLQKTAIMLGNLLVRARNARPGGALSPGNLCGRRVAFLFRSRCCSSGRSLPTVFQKLLGGNGPLISVL